MPSIQDQYIATSETTPARTSAEFGETGFGQWNRTPLISYYEGAPTVQQIIQMHHSRR